MNDYNLIGALLQGLLLLATGVAAYATVRSSRRFETARIVQQLQRDFHDFRNVYEAFGDNGGRRAADSLTPTEQTQVRLYFSFFEYVGYLLKTDALDIVTIDLLFRRRFFSVMEAAAVKKEFDSIVSDLALLVELQQVWADHKTRRNRTATHA